MRASDVMAPQAQSFLIRKYWEGGKACSLWLVLYMKFPEHREFRRARPDARVSVASGSLQSSEIMLWTGAQHDLSQPRPPQTWVRTLVPLEPQEWLCFLSIRDHVASLLCRPGPDANAGQVGSPPCLESFESFNLQSMAVRGVGFKAQQELNIRIGLNSGKIRAGA